MTESTRVDFAQALAISHASLPLTVPENCPVADAVNRVTAAPVNAVLNYPAFDCSAMDGYALHRLDLNSEKLALGAPMFNGEARRTLVPGTAIPIATGEELPDNCGAVTAREQAVEAAGKVLIRDHPVQSGQNLRRRGEDAEAGERVMQSGQKVTAAALGALISYGVTEVPVRRRPRIVLFATGDEIAARSIPDANTPMVRAVLIQAGADVDLAPPIGDDPNGLRRAIGAALDQEADMVVLSGGTSVGDRDHTASAFTAVGAKTLFRGVRMRPGKPVLAARMPDGRTLFGIPGNPLAALVAARFFVSHAIRGGLGLGLETGAPAEGPERTGAATRVLKVRRVFDTDGSSRIDILPGQQSHRLRSLLDADHWLVVPPDPRQPAALFPLSP